MVHAYVLIQTEVGKAAAVAAEVGSVPGVTEAEDVTGPYDVVARAEGRASLVSRSVRASCGTR